MKRTGLISLLVLFLFLFGDGSIVLANESTEVVVNINGDMAIGNIIEISVDLKNIKNLYAASIDYQYDNTIMEVTDITVSHKIAGDLIYKVFNDKAFNGNRARYGFSFIGADKDGLNGNINFIVIKAKILKDEVIEITNDNFKTQLVQRKGNDMVDMTYVLNCDKSKLNVENNNDSNMNYEKLKDTESSDSESKDKLDNKFLQGDNGSFDSETSQEKDTKKNKSINGITIESNQNDREKDITIFVILVIVALSMIIGEYIRYKRQHHKF